MNKDHFSGRTKPFTQISVCACELNPKGLGLSKMRVLLADDNGQILEYVRKLLSVDGCEVVGEVSDGKAAVDAAVKLRPDVMVLDISMPILNGIQAAKRLRHANPDAKIVFLTANRDSETCRAALETGALGYVLKPRLVTDLIPALKLAMCGSSFVSPGCEQDESSR